MKLATLLKGAYILQGGLEATDPRDCVFALLRISADAADLHIAPDYSKSVFTDIAMVLIGQIFIEVLTWCNFTARSGEDRHQPSWVPWLNNPFSRPLCDFGKNNDSRYMAYGDSVPQFQFINTSNEFLTLCVSGIQVAITFSWLDKRYLSFQSAISSGSPKIEIQIISFNLSGSQTWSNCPSIAKAYTAVCRLSKMHFSEHRSST